MRTRFVLGCILSLAASSAFATDELPLATSRGCLACHDIHATLAGPAYEEVARRYNSQDEGKLVKKVLHGGSGSWGIVPMPANQDNGLTEAEARRLVKWILGLKPSAPADQGH